MQYHQSHHSLNKYIFNITFVDFKCADADSVTYII